MEELNSRNLPHVRCVRREHLQAYQWRKGRPRPCWKTLKRVVDQNTLQDVAGWEIGCERDGDWFVHNGNDHYLPYSDDLFRKTFLVVGGEQVRKKSEG